MVALASGSGVRQGELFGLRPGDFDFDNSELAVNRQAVHLAGGGVRETLPKWGRVRTTIIPKKTIWGDELEGRLFDYLQTVGQGVGPPLGGRHRGKADWLAFPTMRGHYRQPGNFGKYELDAARAALTAPTRLDPTGWDPEWSWHSLRHAFCTWMLGDERATGKPAVSDVAVSLVAGHRDSWVTRAMYVGASAGALSEVRAATE